MAHQQLLKTPIILYQMGKVGSSSLSLSLQKRGMSAMHIHRNYFTNCERPLSFEDKIHRLKSRMLFNFYLKKKEVKIITLYRDPLTRNISSFFQNLKYYFSQEELDSLTYDILHEKFNSSTQIHKTPSTWFDNEFKRFLGINILEYPFNKESGYTIISSRNISVFVCTTNQINKLEQELADFLSLETFKIVNDNVGHQKWYKDLYTEFKSKYQAPESMINDLYYSSITKHFFKPEKIQELSNKWIKRHEAKS